MVQMEETEELMVEMLLQEVVVLYVVHHLAVVAVAVKMVASFPISKELVAARVREALDQADASSEIAVHLHPEDARLLDQIAPQEQPGAGGLCPVRIAQDSTVERGGCRVLTAFGVIDNQPGTILRRIRESMVVE